MKILYRISDSGYEKEKPPYVNNKECLKMQQMSSIETVTGL